jgi:exonuclease VII large subunit
MQSLSSLDIVGSVQGFVHNSLGSLFQDKTKGDDVASVTPSVASKRRRKLTKKMDKEIEEKQKALKRAEQRNKRIEKEMMERMTKLEALEKSQQINLEREKALNEKMDALSKASEAPKLRSKATTSCSKSSKASIVSNLSSAESSCNSIPSAARIGKASHSTGKKSLPTLDDILRSMSSLSAGGPSFQIQDKASVTPSVASKRRRQLEKKEMEMEEKREALERAERRNKQIEEEMMERIANLQALEQSQQMNLERERALNEKMAALDKATKALLIKADLV